MAAAVEQEHNRRAKQLDADGTDRTGFVTFQRGVEGVALNLLQLELSP